MTSTPPSSCTHGDDDGRLGHHAQGGARHGIAAPRGLGAPPGSDGARFTTMFPFLARRDAGEAAIEALVEQMLGAAQPDPQINTDVPAGYTYLAQFVDHDITFDATSKIDRSNDPHALVNFRTPRLDLDSLYGSGPADQPFLYDWQCGSHGGAKLLVGHNPPDRCRPTDDQPASIDLPRNAQGRALIGDARNDEHLIISQLHLLFIKFHNRVVEYVRERDGSTGNELFDEAHRIVRWHYQWIVMHDFLRKILGEDAWQSLRQRLTGPSCDVALNVAGPADRGGRGPAIPVEFSAAAYRFGHSMVRPSYELTAGHPALILPLKAHPELPDLGGLRRLPEALTIDWTRFFGPRCTMFSRCIDHRLAEQLFALPPDGAVLARLNLRRGRALGLPAGSDVARAMGESPLDDDELLPHEFWPPERKTDERNAVLRSPPLWFYLLREADARSAPFPDNGKHLGPAGGRIVADVLIGLLESDRSSYLHRRPAWTPELKPDDFTMPDLVEFTLRSTGDTPKS